MAGNFLTKVKTPIIVVGSGLYQKEMSSGVCNLQIRVHVIAFQSKNHSVCSLLPLAYVLACLPLMVPLEPGRTL